MSDWYQHQNWDDQIHAEFYDAYRQASPAVRAIALVEQAELVSRTSKDVFVLDTKKGEFMKFASVVVVGWKNELFLASQVAQKVRS